MIIFKDENEPLLESEAGAGTGPGTGLGHVNPVPQPGHVSPGHGTGTLFESEVETPASEVDKIRKRKIRESFGIWNKVTRLIFLHIFCLYTQSFINVFIFPPSIYIKLKISNNSTTSKNITMLDS